MPQSHREWLKTEHPIYKAWKDVWKRNEKRLRGDEQVLEELRRFDWEKNDQNNDQAYKSRQLQATYINFPEMHAGIITGHLLREAPSPGSALNFGSLGTVESDAVTPDRANDVYFNVDGQGRRGSQWDPWWMSVTRRAMATGHRWIYVDGPIRTPGSRLDEINGARPFLTEYSPLAVTNWDDENGRYNWFVIKVRMRSGRLEESGSFEHGGKYRDGYLLLVREGFDGLNFGGDDFSGGGWWKFDPDLEFIAGDNGKPVHDWWTSTNGEIPMFPFFAEQDEGTTDVPGMSKPTLTALGQVAVSYMNLSSAADFDAWDAGQSITYLVGLPPSAHREVANQLLDGSKVVGVPATINDDGTINLPGIQDGSMGAVASTVWQQRLANKWEEARVLAAREATGDPSTSGASKQMSFEDMMSPRLAHLAANLEAAQRMAIHFLEKRYGQSPSGSVTWVRSFQLRNIIDDIGAIFNMEVLTGYQNPELGGELFGVLIQELALVSDPERIEKIIQQYKDAAKQKVETDAQMRQALAGSGGFLDDEDDDG